MGRSGEIATALGGKLIRKVDVLSFVAAGWTRTPVFTANSGTGETVHPAELVGRPVDVSHIGGIVDVSGLR